MVKHLARAALVWSVGSFAAQPGIAWAQESDTTPPTLVSLSLVPDTVDVSAAPRTVTITVGATDDLSGVDYVSLSVSRPSGGSMSVPGFTLVSGTPNDGLWQAVFTVPRYSAPGQWFFSLNLMDRVTNHVWYGPDLLANLSLPNSVLVYADPFDAAGPTVIGIEIIPAVVDVSDGPKAITVRVHATDNLSGVKPTYRLAVQFKSPTGIQDPSLHFGAANNTFLLVEGTPLDGTWERTVMLPKYSEPGLWQISRVEFWDEVENRTRLGLSDLQLLGLASDVTVLSSPADTTPPELGGLHFTPAFINTALADVSVAVRLDISDDLAGVDVANWPGYNTTGAVRFVSPSGAQLAQAALDTFGLVSGDRLNGTWQEQLFFPRYSEPGTWNVAFVANLSDAARNHVTLQQADLEAKGFPTELIVIRPSLVPDGTLQPDGGTIVDETFGGRAEIVFPPGAVSGPTSVAIDVLEEPPTVPQPTGFQTEGTYYVNVHFDPLPVFPFPAPGATLTLPLYNRMMSGARLHLFFIDPDTGTLRQALNVLGDPCTGIVALDGLTVIFEGVANLSTNVGLPRVPVPVSIDIKPGGEPNSINRRSTGNVPVAILSSAAFDAATIRPETVTLAGATVERDERGRARASLEDVNADGLPDLVVHVSTRGLEVIDRGDIEVLLKALTIDGTAVEGYDMIRVLR